MLAVLAVWAASTSSASRRSSSAAISAMLLPLSLLMAGASSPSSARVTRATESATCASLGSSSWVQSSAATTLLSPAGAPGAAEPYEAAPSSSASTSTS